MLLLLYKHQRQQQPRIKWDWYILLISLKGSDITKREIIYCLNTFSSIHEKNDSGMLSEKGYLKNFKMLPYGPIADTWNSFNQYISVYKLLMKHKKVMRRNFYHLLIQNLNCNNCFKLGWQIKVKKKHQLLVRLIIFTFEWFKCFECIFCNFVEWRMN